ncbi:MAG: hypothetical protein ACXVXM_02455 [Nocardioidaceae bacterium]
MSKRKYRAVHQGWTKTRVNALFEISGHQTMSYSPYEDRDY